MPLFSHLNIRGQKYGNWTDANCLKNKTKHKQNKNRRIHCIASHPDSPVCAAGGGGRSSGSNSGSQAAPRRGWRVPMGHISRPGHTELPHRHRAGAGAQAGRGAEGRGGAEGSRVASPGGLVRRNLSSSLPVAFRDPLSAQRFCSPPACPSYALLCHCVWVFHPSLLPPCHFLSGFSA